MKNKNIIIAIVAVVVVGVGAFFGGIQYQKMQRGQMNNFAGQAGFQGRFGQGGNGQGNQARRIGANGGAVVGEILSTDDTSITVKLMDGSTKIVLLTDKSAINKAATATKSDLKTGENVAVFGTPNSDGSVTATSIQLDPMARMGEPRPSGQPAQ